MAKMSAIFTRGTITAQNLHYLDPSIALSSARPMGFSDLTPWIDPEMMVPSLVSEDRMGAIKELVDRLHVADRVDDSLSFLQAVLGREDLQSTVVGAGVAFPHARSRSVRLMGASIGLSRAGINFGTATHPQAVHLVCLLAVPTYESENYLPFLAALSGSFAQPAIRSQLMSCSTPEAMFHHVTNANHHDGMPA